MRINLLLFIFFQLTLSSKSFGKIFTLETKKLEMEMIEKEKLFAQKKEKNIKDKKDEKDELIYYKGDEVFAYQKKNILKLSGNVHVNKGLMSLASDRAIIYFEKNKEVRKVEALGNVFFFKEKDETSEEIKGFSQTALYFPKERKITLLEEARIERPHDTLEGDILNYNLETEEMSGKKIKGFLSSKEKRQKTK